MGVESASNEHYYKVRSHAIPNYRSMILMSAFLHSLSNPVCLTHAIIRLRRSDGTYSRPDSIVNIANAPGPSQRVSFGVMGIAFTVLFGLLFWLPAIIAILLYVALDHSFFWWLWW